MSSYRSKTFKYKKIKRPRLDVPKYTPARHEEKLRGSVRGKTASSDEERFARALDGRNIPYWFQYEVFTPMQRPGYEYRIDFLVSRFGVWPIEIDSEYWHKTVAERTSDSLRDIQINEVLVQQGVNEIRRVDKPLRDQDEARRKVDELFK